MAHFISWMLTIYLHLCLDNPRPALPPMWLAHYPVRRRPKGLALGQHVMARALLIPGVVGVEAQVWAREGDLQVWFSHAHSGSIWISGVTLCSLSSGHLHSFLQPAGQGWVFLGPWLNDTWMTPFY